MLIEFSCQNYRSIRELQTISFVATGLKSPLFENPRIDVDANNIVQISDNIRLLKTVGIYGPNGSGKSNIISAFKDFILTINETPTAKPSLGRLFKPFKYDAECEKGESFFQIVFLVKGIKYRYGFTVKKNTEAREDSEMDHPEVYSNVIIGKEWLYASVKTNMAPLFLRDGEVITLSKSLDIAVNISIPYPHSLLLNYLAGIVNNNYLNDIIEFFHLTFISSNYNKGYIKTFFLRKVQDSERFREVFLKYLESFGQKFDDVKFAETSEEMERINYPNSKIYLVKKKSINGEETEYKLNLAADESAGTNKLFEMIGAIDFGFHNKVGGALFVIDELDSNFHPSLLLQLIKFFNTPALNTSNAQLLFTSHDTNVMNPKIMRRDQFYFTEKLEDDSTKLYSLADLRGIRNEADFARQYLAGLYGSLPQLSDFVDPIEK